MTDHAMLSLDLACALGWPFAEAWEGEECALVKEYDMAGHWLDYRDPTVCLPLIKWLMVEHECTLQRCLDNKQHGVFQPGFGWTWADTLEEAVARAVIAR